MKKGLIVLLALGLASMLGVLGYLVVDTALHPEPTGKDALPVSASQAASSAETASSSSSSAGVQVNVMRELKTQADVLDAIAYEQSQNKDTVGWLSIPGTKINASVVQSFDNATYLRRDERKQENLYGCYFADFTCNFGNREELSPHTVIYGHSDLKDSLDGPKFSELFRFTQEEFAKSHPIIRFSTAQSAMNWQVFAVYYTDLKLDFTKTDLSGAQLTALAEQAKQRSLYHYDVPVNEGDKILSLVTCTVRYGAQEKDQRFVVAAKLLPEGEQAAPVASLQINPEPKQPQFD